MLRITNHAIPAWFVILDEVKKGIGKPALRRAVCKGKGGSLTQEGEEKNGEKQERGQRKGICKRAEGKGRRNAGSKRNPNQRYEHITRKGPSVIFASRYVNFLSKFLHFLGKRGIINL